MIRTVISICIAPLAGICVGIIILNALPHAGRMWIGVRESQNQPRTDHPSLLLRNTESYRLSTLQACKRYIRELLPLAYGIILFVMWPLSAFRRYCGKGFPVVFILAGSALTLLGYILQLHIRLAYLQYLTNMPIWPLPHPTLSVSIVFHACIVGLSSAFVFWHLGIRWHVRYEESALNNQQSGPWC